MDETILKDYLSLAQAALQLNITERTLVRWGQLRKGPPAVHIGRKKFYRISAIREWLLNREQKS